MTLLLASNGFSQIAAAFVKYALTVVGAFIVGYIATLIVCRLVARGLWNQRMPNPVERALRVLGGIALAALVALLLFPGGWGPGGAGSGAGDGSEAASQPATTDVPTPKSDPKDSKIVEQPVPPATGLRIIVQRGSKYPETFLFEGHSRGVDLAEAKKLIRTRREESGGRLQFIDLLIYRNSTAEIHPDVQALEAYAHDLGLKTSRKKIDQFLPD